MKEQDEYARRRAERRRKIRRRRRFIAAVVLFLIGITVCIVMCFTTFFPVKNVTVGGNARYRKDEIISACQFNKKDQVLAVRAANLTKRLQKTLPYIESVTIKRRLPDTVHLVVREAKVFGAYRLENGQGTEYVLVNRKNRILERKASVGGDTIVIVCKNAVADGDAVVFGDETSKGLIDRLIAGLSERGIAVGEVNADSAIALQATVADRFIVNFGTATDLEKKIDHLRGMIANMEPELTGRIDLSMWTPINPKGTFVRESIEKSDEKAVYLSGGKYYAVTANDRVTRWTEGRPENLPCILCDDAICGKGQIVTFGSKTTADIVSDLRNALESHQIGWTEINLNDMRNIEVKIGDRFTVLWGEATDLSAKAKYLSQQISKMGKNDCGQFDLTEFGKRSDAEMFHSE